MAVRARSEGKCLEFVAPAGGVTLNTPVLIDELLVIPATTKAATLPFTGQITGAWDNIAKATGETWSEGEPLYWDDGNSRCTTTASTHRRVGVALDDATSGAAVGNIRLDGIGSSVGDAAARITVADSGGYLAATTAEAAIAELAATFRRIKTTINAESSDTIAIDLQVATLAGVNVAETTTILCHLRDVNGLDSLVAAFRLAETGAGSEVSTTAKPALIIQTDANGAAQVTVTDVAGGSGAVLFLEIEVCSYDAAAGDTTTYGAGMTVVGITFD